MARILPIYEGSEPAPREHWVDLPVSEAVALFELRPGDFLSELSRIPRFGELDRDLWYRGFKHILVQIEEGEARRAGWKPGFYRSRVKPGEAYRRLIEQALVAELGRKNVVRVDYEPTIDSQGDGAIKVTIVLTPGAIKRLKGGTMIDASIRLRERLGAMHDDRTPIIGYATQAELAQNGGP